jgi:F-type H+-transporting ATPase subunit c
VYKLAKIAGMSLVAVLAMASMAFAQDGDAIKLGAIGTGLTVIGAAYGISRLASAALEGMSRQPEVAGNCQTAMIIAAALIEGFTFYALFICSRVTVN